MHTWEIGGTDVRARAAKLIATAILVLVGMSAQTSFGYMTCHPDCKIVMRCHEVTVCNADGCWTDTLCVGHVECESDCTMPPFDPFGIL